MPKVDRSGEGAPASTEDSPDTTSIEGGTPTTLADDTTPEHQRRPSSSPPADGPVGTQETTISSRIEQKDEVDKVDPVSDGGAEGKVGDTTTSEKDVEGGGGGGFDKALDAAAEIGGDGSGEGGEGGEGGGGAKDGRSSRESSSSKARAGRSQEEYIHDGTTTNDGDGADRPWTTDSNSALATEGADRPGGYGDIDEYRLRDTLSDDEQVSDAVRMYIYIPSRP